MEPTIRYGDPSLPPTRREVTFVMDGTRILKILVGKLESREGLHLTETQQEKEGPAPLSSVSQHYCRL
jgi:hypothetical protein